MTVTDAPRPDVTDMLAVHGALRDTLDAAPALIAGVDPGDPDRVALITNFYDNVLNFLAVHHAGEDELVFPRLLERCADDRNLIERVAAQHHDVDDAVAAATKALADWASGDASAQHRAGAALGELGATLRQHLGDEERLVLPFCEATLSVEEWGGLPGHAMAAFAGDKIWLILGLIRERMTQAQRDLMLAHMPPPAVQMWQSMGEAAFTDLIAAVGPPLG